MIKLGDKVYCWQTINKIGVVIEIYTEENNMLTTGGTTATKIYYKVRYEDNSTMTYRSGEVMKHFD